MAASNTQDGTHATTQADGQAGGLPQFESQYWAGQIGYMLILFLLLYLLIAKVFAPRLRRVLDERSGTIASAVATARSVQDEAAQQAEAARVEVEQARAESRRLAAEAKARITAEAEARRAVEEAEVEARITKAEAQIAATRDAAMADVSAVASETAAAIIERLTGKAATATEIKTAVKGVG